LSIQQIATKSQLPQADPCDALPHSASMINWSPTTVAYLSQWAST